MFSVEFLLNIVQIQVRETLWRVYGHLSHVWQKVEVMRMDFNEHQIMHVPMTEKELVSKQMKDEVAEHLVLDYPDTPDSRYVAQSIKESFYPLEEGSVANSIIIEEGHGFSQP